MPRPATEPQFELKLKLPAGMRKVLMQMARTRLFGQGVTDVARYLLIEGINRQFNPKNLNDLFHLADTLPNNIPRGDAVSSEADDEEENS